MRPSKSSEAIRKLVARLRSGPATTLELLAVCGCHRQFLRGALAMAVFRGELVCERAKSAGDRGSPPLVWRRAVSAAPVRSELRSSGANNR
jgi:hypothetical protein